MAEKKKLSVAEILAAARKMDAGRKQGGAAVSPGGEGEPQSAAGPVQTSAAAASEAQPTAQQQAAVPQQSADSAAAGGSQAEAAAKRSATSTSGGRLTTAEILRLARAGGGAKGGAAQAAGSSARAMEVQAEKAQTAVAPAAQAKAATGPVAGVKPSAGPGASAKAAGGSAAEKVAPGKAVPGTQAEKETASFLTPHRAAKRGPISKAEAAARQVAIAAEPQSKVEPAREKPVRQKAVVPPMPPKPAYAQPKAPAPAAEGETRRGFLLGMVMATVGSFLALGFSTLTASLSLWTLGVARYMFPNVLTEPPSRFKVGFPSDFPPGFVDERFKAQFGVWVVNGEYQGQRQIYALRTVCTHLGCTPNWLEAEQKFKCPCHGSGFYKDGINFEGPAPRPLERYAIRVADDGQLEIDKSKLFQEELGQWSDPASYVSV